MEFSSVITLGGSPVVVNDPDKYPAAAGKANSWRYVVGPAHGSGYVLMLRSMLDTAPFVNGGPVPLVFKEGGKRLAVKRVWILSAARVNSGGAPDDADAVYLCKLVDFRYFLNRWSTSSRFVNCRNWAGGDPARNFLPETAKAAVPPVAVRPSPYPWNDVLKLLWNDCKLLGPWTNVAGIRSAPPEDLYNPGGNSWRFLNDVAGLAGRVMHYDGEADKYSIRKLTIDATPLDDDVAEDLEYDARPFSPPSSIAPETIRVHFVKKLEDYGLENDTAPASNWATTGALTWIDVPTRVRGAIPGTIASLWASTPAVIKHKTSRTYVNEREVRETAQEMADAWLMQNGAEQLSRAHMLLRGIQKRWLPNESIRETIVRDDGVSGLLTEVLKYPGLPSFDPDFSWEATAPGGDGVDENFKPIDVARRSLPNYPRLPNIVEVFDIAKTRGAMIQANNSGVHPGYIQRPVEGQLARQEKCWILFVDDYGEKRGAVPAKNGDYYGPARLAGLHDYSGERLPLYLVRSSASTNMILFRLKAPLATGGRAEARQIVYNTDTGKYDELPTKIYVVDWYSTPRGMWQAPSVIGTGSSAISFEGIAQLRAPRKAAASSSSTPAADPEYEIIWMETLAWEIEGTLDADLSTASGSAGVKGTVTAAWEQGKHPGAKVDVHDDQNFFPRALKGAKFKATRSEHEGAGGLQSYYKITNCQQACLLATAMLTAPMCGETAAVTGFAAATPSPFNQVPETLPTAIANPRGHRGLSGDQVTIRWNQAASRYEVDGVTKHVRAFAVQMEYDTGTKTFRARYLETAAEVCTTDDPDWTNIFTAAPCTT